MTPLIFAFALAGATDSIDRVVVFADRAEVTRVTTAHCAGGAGTAVFESVPESVDPRTLRGEAEGDAIAVGVSSTKVAQKEALDDRVRNLRQQIEDIDIDLTARARAEQDDNERSRTLQSYGTYFRSIAIEEVRNSKPDTGKWDALLNSLSADANSAITTHVARAAEVRTLQRHRERLAAELARLAPSAAPSSLSATVALQCKSDTKVRLSYVVPGATWSPEYDLRFTGPAKGKTGDGKATLVIAGVVTQSSGEDWTDAEIWLSTAKPALGGEAPLPNPIYVSGGPESKQKTLVQAQEHRADDLKNGETTKSGPQAATLDDGGKSFLLKLPKRVTVHPDGRPYWFPVDELATSARSSLVAVPAASPYVFQVAALKNPASFPLMAGLVHVFRGPTFVGNVATEYRAPGEPFEISLGIDDEIALERQDLLQQQRAAGLLSSTKSIASAWRTILHNRSDDDVTVEIREQVPVSKTTDITVDIDSQKTAPGYELDKVRGHLTWKTPIKKGATEKRDLAFSIALPKDWHVN